MAFSMQRKRNVVIIMGLVTMIALTYWIIHSYNIEDEQLNHATFQKRKSSPIMVTASFDIPGLGNLLFQYASLLGISKANHLKPVIFVNSSIYTLFYLPEPLVNNPSYTLMHWGKILESKSSSYDQHIMGLSSIKTNVVLVGYLQSWYYFRDLSDQIRRTFMIKYEIQTLADRFLSDIKVTNTSIYVGLHIRRGDLLSEDKVKYGYNVAPVEYIHRAMEYYKKTYADAHLVFVVCTDDLKWSKENVDSRKFTVVFSEGQTDLVDFAILSSCNHSIMTVGTYGWWTSYLANGDVVYYKNHVRPLSRLENSFSKTKHDYFPPKWIGLA